MKSKNKLDIWDHSYFSTLVKRVSINRNFFGFQTYGFEWQLRFLLRFFSFTIFDLYLFDLIYSVSSVFLSLSFLVRQSNEPGWLDGTLNGKSGLIPENYVEVLK